MSPSVQHGSSPAPPPRTEQVGKSRSHTDTWTSPSSATAEHVQESTKGLHLPKHTVI